MLCKHIIERSSRDRKIGLLGGEQKTYANADGETDVRKVENKKQKYSDIFTIQLNKIH